MGLRLLFTCSRRRGADGRAQSRRRYGIGTSAAFAGMALLVLAFALATRLETFAQAGIASAFVMRKAGTLPAQTGIWRSRGYGWIWVIKDNRIDIYDAAKGYCRKVDDPEDRLEDLLDPYEVSRDGSMLRLSLGDPEVRYLFDRIEALPATCSAPQRNDARAIIDAVATIFDTHYAFFTERQVDWPAAVTAARARVSNDTSDAELFAVLRDMLSAVGDNHVGLFGKVGRKSRSYSPGDGPTITALAAQADAQGLSETKLLRRWEKRYWSGIGKTLLKGRGQQVGDGNIYYGFVAKGIGYIAIRSTEDFEEDDEGEIEAVDTAMERALRALKDAKAIIVDLSQNDGGYDLLARQIAGRFAAQRTFAYAKRPGDNPDAPLQKLYVDPSQGTRFTGPVYVLTTDETVSAAEILTLSLRALPNVIHVGEPTRGVLSDELSKELPNGWLLTLSNEVYTDSEGQLWEGIGIAPQVEIGVFSKTDVLTGHIDAVRAVVELARMRLGS